METTDYQTFTKKSTTKEERERLGIGDIWSNSVQCKACKDIIRSKNVHDFVWCSCKNIAVDGGSWYLKRVGGEQGYEDLSETYDDLGENND